MTGKARGKEEEEVYWSPDKGAPCEGELTPQVTTTLNKRLSFTTALFVWMGVTAGADKETRQHVWCYVHIDSPVTSLCLRI